MTTSTFAKGKSSLKAFHFHNTGNSVNLFNHKVIYYSCISAKALISGDCVRFASLPVS